MPQPFASPVMTLTQPQPTSRVLRRPLFVAVHRSEVLPLDARDIRLLSLVWEYRLLSARQINALMRDWPWEQLRHRLTELFHRGYLDRPRHQLYLKLAGEEPWDMVYAPTPKGLKALSIETRTRFDTKNQHLSPYFMSHRLAVNGLRIAVEEALTEHPSLALAFWLWDRQWHETVQVTTRRGAREVKLFPDSFFSLVDLTRQQPAYFFSEYDTGSEDLGRLVDKLRLYTQLAAQPRLTAPLFPQDQIKGFRVLVIVRNRARQQHLITRAQAQALAKPGMFYTTTKDRIDPPQLLTMPIWTTLKGEPKAIVDN
jgi:hypothetical protein